MGDDVDEFLAHHGIKGMKWGVRRTDAQLARAGGSSSSESGKTSSAGGKASGGSGSGARALELEAKYVKKGLSPEEAQLRAIKRKKIEKALAIAGVVTVVGIGAYVGQRELGKRYSGVVLEAGADLKYINALGPKADYDRRLYTTINEGDTKKYRGLLAKQLQSNQAGTTVYETTLRTTEAIKAPSHKQAEKIYKELVRDGKLEANFGADYKTFNQGLVNTDAKATRFYSELKKRGYNAVLDSNDQFISGYDTKKPLILFNAASSTVKAGEKAVSQQTIDKQYNRQMASGLARQMAGPALLGSAAVGISKLNKSRNKYDAVNKYMEEHPNTEMSPAEIYNTLKVKPDGTFTVPNPPKKKGATK